MYHYLLGVSRALRAGKARPSSDKAYPKGCSAWRSDEGAACSAALKSESMCMCSVFREGRFVQHASLDYGVSMPAFKPPLKFQRARGEREVL